MMDSFLKVSLSEGPNNDGNIISFVLNDNSTVWVMDSSLADASLCMKALETFFVGDSFNLTHKWMVGRFYGNSTDKYHIFGSLPIDLVMEIMRQSFTEDAVDSFLALCMISFPELTIYRIKGEAMDNVYVNELLISSKNVWVLLAWAEAFDCNEVFISCAERLHRMICLNGCAHRSKNDCRLPPSLFADFNSLNKKTIEQLPDLLLKHFHKYGPIPYIDEEPRNVVQDNKLSQIPVSKVKQSKSSQNERMPKKNDNFIMGSDSYTDSSYSDDSNQNKYSNNLKQIYSSDFNQPRHARDAANMNELLSDKYTYNAVYSSHDRPSTHTPAQQIKTFSSPVTSPEDFLEDSEYSSSRYLCDDFFSENRILRHQYDTAKASPSLSFGKKYADHNKSARSFVPPVDRYPIIHALDLAYPDDASSDKSNFTPQSKCKSQDLSTPLSQSSTIGKFSYSTSIQAFLNSLTPDGQNIGMKTEFRINSNISGDGRRKASHSSDRSTRNTMIYNDEETDSDTDANSISDYSNIEIEEIAHSDKQMIGNADLVEKPADCQVNNGDAPSIDINLARKRAMSRLRDYREKEKATMKVETKETRAKNYRLRMVQMEASVARISSIPRIASITKNSVDALRLVDSVRQLSPDVGATNFTRRPLSTERLNGIVKDAVRELEDCIDSETQMMATEQARRRAIERIRDVKRTNEMKELENKKKMIAKREKQLRDRDRKIIDLLERQHIGGEMKQSLSSFVPSPAVAADVRKIPEQHIGSMRSEGSSKMTDILLEEASALDMPPPPPPPLPTTYLNKSASTQQGFALKPLQTFSRSELEAVGLSPDDLLIQVASLGSSETDSDAAKRSSASIYSRSTSPAITNIHDSYPSSAESVIDSATQVQFMIDSILKNPQSIVESPSAVENRSPLRSMETVPPWSQEVAKNSRGGTSCDVLSITVVRAWDLNEGLGDSSPYVVVDWGKLGRAATQAVPSTTCPRFGSILKFKSPLKLVELHSRQGVPNVCSVVKIEGIDYFLQDFHLKIFVYSRNQSVSDELLGETTLTPSQLADYFDRLSHTSDNQRRTPSIVLQLVTLDYSTAGFIEIEIMLNS